MSSFARRRLVAGLGLLALVALGAVAILAGRDDGYVLRVPLENASGLQDGSAVRVGGLSKGKVELDIRPDDSIVAELHMRGDAPRVDKAVAVKIVSANFLGQKRVELTPTGGGDRAPSGFTVPRAQVSTPTDLDQVLGILDTDTRARLQVLINEAGEAVVGRKVDLRRFVEEFPLGERDLTTLLTQLKTDNKTMRDLVVRSDRFVAQAATDRGRLVRAVDTVGQTAETVSARRAELTATLDRAPQTLRTLQGFLGDLRTTAADLGPAAQDLSATAPPLAATLAGVDPFRRAAAPALDQASDVAPALSRLGVQATPVLRQARPTVQRLATLSAALPGVTDTLDGSVENVFAILENWSRAIQFRDGLSHVFRGEASFSPDAVQSAAGRLQTPVTKRKAKRSGGKAGDRPTTPGATPDPGGTATPAKPGILDELPTKPLTDPVDKTVKAATDAIKGVVAPPPPDAGDPGDGVLDFLLGS